MPHGQRRIRLLIIDDDPMIGAVASSTFQAEAYETRIVGKAANGLRHVQEWSPDVVLLDHRPPDRMGVEMLTQIGAIDRDLPVLFIGASRHSAITIEALREGAFDYLPKPLDPELLRMRVQDAWEARRLLRTPVVLQNRAGEDPSAEPIIGQSAEMQQVYKAIGRIASRGLAMLVQGETGTGKQLVARAAHSHSSRALRPMRCVSCEEVTPRELDAVLFGSNDVPGAGLIEECAGGTILLKEVSEIGLSTQSRLLRLIRARDPDDQASTQRDLPVFVFSTEYDVSRLVADRRVRGDLFYELCGNLICLPPLRQRGTDIRLLTEYFIGRLSQIRESFGELPARVSEKAMRMMETYPWPGNVSELKSVLRRAHLENQGTVLADEYLRQRLAYVDPPTRQFMGWRRTDDAAGETTLVQHVEDDPHHLADSQQPPEHWREFVACNQHRGSSNLYAQAVEQMERGLITEVLAHTGGNLAAAARMLGITRVSVRKKIHALGIDVPGRAGESVRQGRPSGGS